MRRQPPQLGWGRVSTDKRFEKVQQNETEDSSLQNRFAVCLFPLPLMSHHHTFADGQTPPATHTRWGCRVVEQPTARWHDEFTERHRIAIACFMEGVERGREDGGSHGGSNGGGNGGGYVAVAMAVVGELGSRTCLCVRLHRPCTMEKQRC